MLFRLFGLPQDAFGSNDPRKFGGWRWPAGEGHAGGGDLRSHRAAVLEAKDLR
jgi:hypothetical protein